MHNLTLCNCYGLIELPTGIGNIVSLEELVLEDCSDIRVLPVSICQLKALRALCLTGCSRLEELPGDLGNLTNLQALAISQTGIHSLPPSLNKLTGFKKLELAIDVSADNACSAIGWLKDFVDIEGTLHIAGLENMPGLTDAQCANLVSKHNLEHFILSRLVSFFFLFLQIKNTSLAHQ